VEQAFSLPCRLSSRDARPCKLASFRQIAGQLRARTARSPRAGRDLRRPDPRSLTPDTSANWLRFVKSNSGATRCGSLPHHAPDGFVSPIHLPRFFSHLPAQLGSFGKNTRYSRRNRRRGAPTAATPPCGAGPCPARGAGHGPAPQPPIPLAIRSSDFAHFMLAL
jgi:hypothetical protein